MASLRAMVWDALRVWPRRRKEGELIAGASFIVPLLTDSKSTTFGPSSPIEAGNMIWEPTEFDVFESVWRAIMSSTGSGVGVLQLYNYNTRSEIARLTVTANRTYAEKTVVVSLPASGPSVLIGGRLWRASGSGTIIAHVSNMRIREN